MAVEANFNPRIRPCKRQGPLQASAWWYADQMSVTGDASGGNATVNLIIVPSGKRSSLLYTLDWIRVSVGAAASCYYNEGGWTWEVGTASNASLMFALQEVDGQGQAAQSRHLWQPKRLLGYPSPASNSLIQVYTSNVNLQVTTLMARGRVYDCQLEDIVGARPI